MAIPTCPVNGRHEFRQRLAGEVRIYPSGFYCIHCLDELSEPQVRLFREALKAASSDASPDDQGH